MIKKGVKNNHIKSNTHMENQITLYITTTTIITSLMEVKLTVGAVEALTTTNSSINLHIRIRKVITIKAALH